MKVEFQLNAALVLRLLLAALLLWAGLTKLPDPHAFHAALAGYRLGLPPAALKLVAVVLPWFEILLGLSLLARFRIEATAVLVVLLFGAFAALTAQAWARGLDIACGCFHLDFLSAEAARRLESPAFATVRNLLLLAAALWLWRGTRAPAP